MDKSLIAPLPVTPVSPEPEFLPYAANRELERAIFKLIGWIAITIASLQLVSLFLDALLLPQKSLPEWLQILMFGEQPLSDGWTNLISGYFYAAIHPAVSKALAMLLLAGGIGCLRGHARTRWWLICYAIPQLLLEIVSAAVTILSNLDLEQLGTVDTVTVASSSGFYMVAWFATAFAWPIIILYLMTRPYVATLFDKRPQ